jgi:hypothetical protein
MRRGKKTRDVKEQIFKRLFWVNSGTFEKMKSILQKEYDRQHQKGGSPAKLSLEQVGVPYLDRNAQFDYINRRSGEFIQEGQPVISVDTKKKELIGNFKHTAGRSTRPRLGIMIFR